MSAHTPGPWAQQAQKSSHRSVCTVYNTALGWVDVYAPNRSPTEDFEAENSANANLIEASPDMLAALIVAREIISTDRNALADTSMVPDGEMDPDDAAAVADYDAALLQIDAAIAKATPSNPT